MEEKRPASSAGRTGKKRKKPLKQRIAIAIVRAVEGREQKKAVKKGRKENERKAPQRSAVPQGKPAAQQPRRRPTPEQRKVQIRRLRRRRRAFRVTLGVLAVCILFLILARTVLFKIQNIEITNPEAANYTAEQIVAQCGIAYGTQNLFSCDLDKVEKNIEQRLPYIGKATVERDFPSSLRVRVESTKTAAAMAYGTGYLLIDAEGKMLESVETAPEDIPVLRCKTEFEMNLGQYIGVSPNGKKADDQTKEAAQMISLYKKINAAAQQAQIQEITLIDIRDARAITLMYQNRLTLHLGTQDSLEQKLKTAAKTIAAESDASRTRTGAIDLTSIPYVFSRDTYETDDKEQTTDVTEPESATEKAE